MHKMQTGLKLAIAWLLLLLGVLVWIDPFGTLKIFLLVAGALLSLWALIRVAKEIFLGD